MVNTTAVSSVRLWVLVVGIASLILLLATQVSASDPAEPNTETGVATETVLEENREVSPLPSGYVVRSGDNLWRIVQRLAPDHADLRQATSQLIDFNRIGSSTIFPGQVLHLPPTWGG